MWILIDANLSFRLAKSLRFSSTLFIHANRIELSTSPSDTEIWSYAKTNDFVIRTRDIDFLLLSIQFGSPPKVILLTTNNKTTAQFANLINEK